MAFSRKDCFFYGGFGIFRQHDNVYSVWDVRQKWLLQAAVDLKWSPAGVALAKREVGTDRLKGSLLMCSSHVYNERHLLVLSDVSKGRTVNELDGFRDIGLSAVLAFNDDASKVFVGGTNSGNIMEFDVSETGLTFSKEFCRPAPGTTCLCVSSQGDFLLSGGESVIVWDIATGTILKEFKPTAGGVTKFAAFSPDSKLVFSSDDKQQILVWNCHAIAGKGSSRKKTSRRRKSEATVESEPLTTLPLNLSTPGIRCEMNIHDNILWLGVCCQDRSGIICKLNVIERAPILESSCVLKSNNLYGLDLSEIEESGRIGVSGRSTKSQPVFGTANIFSQDGSIEPEIYLSGLPSTEATHGTVDDILNENDQDSEGSDDEEAAEENLTIRERLALLESSSQQLDKVDADCEFPLKSKQSARKRQRETETCQDDSSNPKASISLATVLEQALKSNDNQLLEVVLRNSELRAVHATVKNLSSARVLVFLEKITTKFEQRPARANQLLIWINAILEIHGRYLLNVPDLASSLSGLYQIIENRLGVFPKLLQLHSRVEFLISQVDIRSSREDPASRKRRLQPAVIYDEEAAIENDDDEETEAIEDFESDEIEVDEVAESQNRSLESIDDKNLHRKRHKRSLKI